jgi:hypothetical protein
MPSEEAQRVFRQIDTVGRGYITFGKCRPGAFSPASSYFHWSKSCLTTCHWRHMGEEEVWLLLILNLSTRWGQVVSVMPQLHFSPGERTPSTHWIGGWVGLRACLDAGTRIKILCPCRGSNPNCPARNQTLYCLSYRYSPFSVEVCEIKTRSKVFRLFSCILEKMALLFGYTHF